MKEKREIWFVQEGRWQRTYAVHPMGWAASVLFLIAFFGVAAFFISLEPFTPIDYGLLVLWWLSVIALMLGFHLLARNRTDRRWLASGKTE